MNELFPLLFFDVEKQYFVPGRNSFMKQKPYALSINVLPVSRRREVSFSTISPAQKSLRLLCEKSWRPLRLNNKANKMPLQSLAVYLSAGDAKYRVSTISPAQKSLRHLCEKSWRPLRLNNKANKMPLQSLAVYLSAEDAKYHVSTTYPIKLIRAHSNEFVSIQFVKFVSIYF
jgi:hypothetical protein